MKRREDIRKVKSMFFDLEQRVKALEDKYAKLNMFMLKFVNDHAKIVEFEIDLPYHLYRTWHALKRGSFTADEMAAITERSRADESRYLNLLVTMGLAKKQRNGRKVVFTLIQESNAD
jgi:Fic family protein